jgi:hypothetical protein
VADGLGDDTHEEHPLQSQRYVFVRASQLYPCWTQKLQVLLEHVCGQEPGAGDGPDVGDGPPSDFLLHRYASSICRISPSDSAALWPTFAPRPSSVVGSKFCGLYA